MSCAKLGGGVISLTPLHLMCPINCIFCVQKVERLQQSDQSGDASINQSSILNGGNKLSDVHTHNHYLNDKIREERKMERENRQNIVLWKKPLITMQYFVLELTITIQEYWKRFVCMICKLNYSL